MHCWLNHVSGRTPFGPSKFTACRGTPENGVLLQYRNTLHAQHVRWHLFNSFGNVVVHDMPSERSAKSNCVKLIPIRGNDRRVTPERHFVFSLTHEVLNQHPFSCSTPQNTHGGGVATWVWM